VGTDWDRFQWLKRNARGAAAADRLTEALTLVRGEPLTGAEDWAWVLPNITEMRCAIGDAAQDMAQLRLEAQDLPRATAAARQGLRGSPWDQRLYGDLMLAAHKAGNPAGVIDVWSELRARLEDEDDDVDIRIDPDVRAIYERCEGTLVADLRGLTGHASLACASMVHRRRPRQPTWPRRGGGGGGGPPAPGTSR